MRTGGEIIMREDTTRMGKEAWGLSGKEPGMTGSDDFKILTTDTTILSLILLISSILKILTTKITQHTRVVRPILLLTGPEVVMIITGDKGEVVEDGEEAAWKTTEVEEDIRTYVYDSMTDWWLTKFQFTSI